MHARQKIGSWRKRRNAFGQKIVDYLTYGAEASNIGILVQALGGWFPAFAAFAQASPLSYFMLIGDPAIYFLRSLIRLTKLAGKKFFNIEFEEERHGKPHPWQTAGNLFTLGCFVLAIALFCGALVASPVGITLAWTAGLLGQSCVGFFDYIWPEKQAYKKHQQLLNNSLATDEMIDEAAKEYEDARKSRKLFMGLLFGLSLLLICGSAAVFAPPLLVPILGMVSNLASLGLGFVACSRFYNWCKQRWRRSGKDKEAEAGAEPEAVSEIEMTSLNARAPSAQMAPPLSPTAGESPSSVDEIKRPSLPSLPSQAGCFSPRSRRASSCAQEVGHVAGLERNPERERFSLMTMVK